MAVFDKTSFFSTSVFAGFGMKEGACGFIEVEECDVGTDL